jgi:hypothetical protein
VHRKSFQTVQHLRTAFDGFAQDYDVVYVGAHAGIAAVRGCQVLLTIRYR